ncbi:MAG: family metallopeptidase [Nocardioidaceae bacterium]|nr:family metallopeptidase [Nocardioidaceae bacterium]
MTPSADLRYLTGYDAKPLERLTCLVLPADGDPVLVVPALERAAALASPVGATGLEVAAWQETDDPYALVTELLPAAARTGTLAVDNRMWAEKVLALRTAVPDARQVLADPVLSALRMRKAPDEVQALRAAGQAVDRVHRRMGEWLRAGRTERQIGRDIAAAIVAEGHVSVDFVIVGSGPNGASPHHDLSDRLIEPGDPVVVDIGGTMESGYCSDSTRTYVAGHSPPDDFARYYEVLRTAQDRQCAYARPGVSAEALDAVGRDVITAAGYGKAFLHRTGHGIGMETHEEPYIVAGNHLVLEPGMAFSIEPGIYLPGRHGARIEDIVVCTDEGAERLNTTSRELTVLAG